MSEASDKVTIKIPRPLYNTLKEIIGGSGFDSVTDFIVYCMRDIAYSARLEEGEALSKHELEMVRQRLRSLGYL